MYQTELEITNKKGRIKTMDGTTIAESKGPN